MAELFLFLVFLIPAMLGLAEILHIVRLYILYPKDTVSYVLIFLKNENPTGRLSFALEQYYWLGKKYAGNIIAVDSGLDEENYELCREITLKHGAIFCGEDELEKVLKEIK